MLPKFSQKTNEFIVLAPQNEYQSYAPKNIQEPIITTTKRENQKIQNKTYLEPKITIFNAMQRQFTSTQTSKQILKSEIQFWEMLYRIISQYLFILPIISYMNNTLLLVSLYLYLTLSVCQLFHYMMIFAFYITVCKINGFALKNVFKNVQLLIQIILNLVVVILALYVISFHSISTDTQTFINQYKIYIIILSNYFTLWNIYYFFTHFSYHKNIKVPNAFAFHSQLLLGSQFETLDKICAKTEYYDDNYGEYVQKCTQRPNGIKREADGIQYDDD